MKSVEILSKEIKKRFKQETINRFFKELEKNNIPLPVIEFKFHNTRKWRFDYCWIDKKIALEVEGGVFTNGRHTRGKGFMGDMEKYNTAVLYGYKVIRTTPTLLMSSQNINLIKQLVC